MAPRPARSRPSELLRRLDGCDRLDGLDRLDGRPGPETQGQRGVAPVRCCLRCSQARRRRAVSALAIERETLALCRERQEIVTGIVTLEGELRALLAEARDEAARTAATATDVTVAEPPIVKESTPVRVVRHLPPSPEREEPAEAAKADTPKPPAWSWFSIIGTAGDLRAGISDGARVWFVREGDRLPGAVTVERIDARPPGVHVGGADETALPYRPRPDGAIPAGGIAGGEGS